jgi:hypothetical protein
MRSLFLSAFFPAFVFNLAWGLAPMNDLTEAEALGTASRWASLVAASDTKDLETLLHRGYLHTHGSGLVETKEIFLEALRSGSRDYVRCKMVDPKVNLLGRVAVVSGVLDLKVLARKRIIEGTNRFTMVVARTDKGMQVAAYQATPLTRKE